MPQGSDPDEGNSLTVGSGPVHLGAARGGRPMSPDYAYKEFCKFLERASDISAFTIYGTPARPCSSPRAVASDW
jgi:hypothetical protein